MTYLPKSTICIILIFTFNSNIWANSMLKDANNLNELANKKLKNYHNLAQNLSKVSKENLNQNLEQIKPTIDNTLKQANSRSYQDQINQLFKQISPSIDLEELTKSYQAKQHLHLNQLMIFVSSSMPKESLQDYSIQSQKAGGVLVLRGLIDNSLKKTTAFIHSLNQHGTKAIIDPLSYQNFDVRHVPQIVVINDNHGCKWGRCNHTPLHDKITGNIALEYALKQIAQDGDSTRKEAGRFLSKLRGT